MDFKVILEISIIYLSCIPQLLFRDKCWNIKEEDSNTKGDQLLKGAAYLLFDLHLSNVQKR